ncbi:phage protein [Streptococcus pneumoniae]|nr:phage protein [Streptococcus pneumoniae]
MTETTYENLTRRINRISAEMQEIGEKNGLSRLSLLASQTKFIKEELSRLLWIELPELNDSHKIEAVSKSTTGIFFSPGIFEMDAIGIFEMDAMRQAFFKRQAMHFFENEAEQQAYIEHAEKEYLEATITLKDILFNSKNGTQKANKSCLIEKFEEAMQ